MWLGYPCLILKWYETSKCDKYAKKKGKKRFRCESVVLWSVCSSGNLLHSLWTTSMTASVKMGRSFNTYQEVSIITGYPESTGKIGCSRCTWQAWTPSRRRLTSSHSHLHISVGLMWKLKQMNSAYKLITVTVLLCWCKQTHNLSTMMLYKLNC